MAKKTKKKASKPSKNEQAAAKAGMSTKDFNKAKKSGGSYKNDASYKKLSADQKAMVDTAYKYANDKDKSKKMAEALKKAQKQSAPYMKQFYAIAEDELMRSYESITGDYSQTKARQEERARQLQEDLEFNRTNLSLAEQNDMATIARNQKMEVEQLTGSIANNGLTFSTKGDVAKQRLAEQQSGLRESTQRKYNEEKRLMETNALRTGTDITEQIKELDRKYGESLTSIGRKYETTVGTDKLGGGQSWYDKLGGISGDLYEQGVKDVEQRKQSIFGGLTGASLNF